MPHAEMVIILPVIAFTFLVMGWIVSRFRGYLKRRDAIVAAWDEAPATARQDTHPHHPHRHAA